ncbi:MAG: GMC family oxidoreductase [Planctomycetota bacterium]|nr:GMC family oxidoreductase [Planctomycetota bacterium]
MIADLDDPSLDALPDYDVVIVGSGPAGMTLARELGGQDLRVCVLESGLEKPTPRGDRLREVQSTRIHIKAYSRERVLGGASSTWSGLSSPLDDVDLEVRPYLEQSGWPLERAELDDYYAQAAQRYRFPAPELYAAGGFDTLRAEGEREPAWEMLREKIFLAAADAQDFGQEWKSCCDGEGTDLFLDATLVELESAEGVVGSAIAQTRSGRRVPIRARIFVLAAGGIENARLLLDTNLGNEHDQVGRYMMNHPKNYCGILKLAQPVQSLPYFFGCQVGANAGYAGLHLPTEVQSQRELVNAYVRMEPLFPWSDNEGVECLVLLVKKCKSLLTFWTKSQGDAVIAMRDYSETGDDSDLSNTRRSALGTVALGLRVALHLPSVLTYAFFRLSGRSPKVRRVRLRNFMEMEPRAENRVTLAEATDPNGRPVAQVSHDTSKRDRASLLALHEVLREEFERTGLGTLGPDLEQAAPWPITQDASHHMGTTRMGNDLQSSVVTPQCRVHSTTNLYCAGASVFPTSGCANPTWTIVALSIRLARHLRAELQGSEA